MSNDDDHQELKKILGVAFPPVDAALERDLWSETLRRLKERERNTHVPLYDWVLVGMLIAPLVFFPSLLLLLAYQL